MKKVIYLINCLSVGGAQKALLNLVQTELTQDYQPYIIALVKTPGLQAQFANMNAVIHTLDVKTMSGLLLSPWRLAYLTWKIRPDIIHGWMYHGNLVATLAWLFAGLRPVLFWGIHHTPDQSIFSRLHHRLLLVISRLLSFLPRQVIYVSKRSQLRHAELGFCKKNAIVIANGVDASIDILHTDNLLRESLNLAGNIPVIGSLTRFVAAKDIPNLIAAIHLFLQMGNKANFILAGEGMCADNLALVALLREANCLAQVRLLGVITDVKALLSIMDIATLSSRREAFPLFLAEAMAASVVCVATDVGDIAEFVAGTGFIVEKENPAALANAWAEVLRLSATSRKQLGQAAQQRIQHNYSMDKVVIAYRQLFQGAST